jgi:hypothetical protein
MLTRKLSVLALALLLALPFASAFSGCCGKCNEEELSKELEKELDKEFEKGKDKDKDKDEDKDEDKKDSKKDKKKKDKDEDEDKKADKDEDKDEDKGDSKKDAPKGDAKAIIDDMTPDSLTKAVKKLGWEVVGEPTKLNDGSITLPIVKGVTGGAVSLNDFDPANAADFYIDTMQKNDGAAVARSGKKVVTVLMPGNKGKADELMEEIVPGYKKLSTGGGGGGGDSANAGGGDDSDPGKPSDAAGVIDDMDPDALTAEVKKLGWEVVGEPTKLNDKSITLPIVKGSVGGAVSLNDFGKSGGKTASKIFEESMLKNDGAVVYRSGARAFSVLMPSNKAAAQKLANQILKD